MDRVVPVSFENTGLVAAELVEKLKNRTFTVTSFYRNTAAGQETPKIISGLQLYDGVLPPEYDNSKGYVVDGGRTIILLTPRRKISWDLIVENVTVTFLDDGNIIIQRILPNDSTLWRILIMV